jgi:AraC-like DNA-binding protein
VGSFTTSFGRAYGQSPTEYRAAFPPASARAMIPTCVQLAYARPKSSRFGEDSRATPA